MTNEAIENLKKNLKELTANDLIDLYRNTNQSAQQNILDSVLLKQLQMIRNEMLERMGERV